VTDCPEQSGVPGASPERRLHYRHAPASFAYVEMGENNGGIILNLNEGGLAVQAAVGVTDQHLARLRFQLSPACDWVNATGRIVWQGESKKKAGIRFLNLPESARVRIRNWISLERSHQKCGEEQGVAGENGKPISESSPRQDLEALPKGGLENARKKEDFWAPYPPGIHSGVPRQTGPAKLHTSVHLRPSGIFGPSGIKVDTQTVRSDGSGNGWKIGILVSFVAAISLAIGISIGNGSLHRWLGRNQELMQTAWEQAKRMGPAAEHMILGGTVSPRPSAEEESGNGLSGSSQPSTGDAPPDDSTSPAIGRLARDAPETQPRYDTANLLMLPANQLQSGIWINVPESGEPSSRLNMPPKTVFSSLFIEISSQRSVVVAPMSSGETSKRKKRLQVGDLMLLVDPVYPTEAIQKQTEGTVELRATVSREGEFRNIWLVSGPPLLAQAAMNAVSGWRYRPTQLDGQPIETVDDITMAFRLP
jgi:TonB family protein